MYFDKTKSLVYIPFHEGNPFMEGEIVGDNTVLNKYCDVEGDFWVYSYYVYPEPTTTYLSIDDVPIEDIPEWV